MQCKRCGAELLDTDTFCVNCGQKVGEEAVCPVCGEPLREGTKFCHNCGTSVEDMIKANAAKRKVHTETEEMPLVQQKTIDIPFDIIEKSLVLEAEQAIEKRTVDEQKEALLNKTTASDEIEDEFISSEPKLNEKSEQELNTELEQEPNSISEEYAPPDSDDFGMKQERMKQERMNQERMNQERSERKRVLNHDIDQEDGYDNDDYDDEEDEDDNSLMSKISIIIAIVIAFIILIVAFLFWKNNGGRINLPGNNAFEETTATDETSETASGALGEFQGRIQILNNAVNVRDEASMDSNVVAIAGPGETYQYYELVDKAWYHIEYEDGKDGYVSAKYVEEIQ